MSEPDQRPANPDDLLLRRWFAFYVPVWGLVAFAAVAVARDCPGAGEYAAALWARATGSPEAMPTLPAVSPTLTWAALAGLGAYMALASTLVPLPTTALMILLGGPDSPLRPLLPDGPGLVIIAAVAAAGTAAGNLNDYHLVTWLFRFRTLDRLRRTDGWQSLAALFDRCPFAALWTMALVPIPVDFVRILAISRRYSRVRYAAAYFLGRFPRYLALLYLGRGLELGWRAAGALVLLGVAAAAVAALRKRSNSVSVSSSAPPARSA